MGSICSSSKNVNTARTAKVITPSGLLMEFSSPVATSLALGDDQLSHFVCDADHLLFDEYVPPMRPEDHIVPGGLYFILLNKFREHPVTGASMAMLAIKANAALLSGKEVEGKITAKSNFGGGNVNQGAFRPRKNRRRKKNRLMGRKGSYRMRLGIIEEGEEHEWEKCS